MERTIWILLVISAGAVLPFQAGFNSRMGKAIDSSLWASIISFVVGALALGLYALISRSTVYFPGIKALPHTTWLAGIFGAFYVFMVVSAFPKLGPALTFSLVVAGQMIVSVLLDHFNILVHQQHSVNIQRILGVLLIIAGVIMIRKY